MANGYLWEYRHHYLLDRLLFRKRFQSLTSQQSDHQLLYCVKSLSLLVSEKEMKKKQMIDLNFNLIFNFYHIYSIILNSIRYYKFL